MTILIVVSMIIAAAVFALITILGSMYVCSPSEVLIFSGRKWRGLDGQVVGFRVVRGGRAMRIPIVEVVDRLPLTNMGIELAVTNAFSKGGVPLNVQAVANVKLPSEEPLLHNALERFLGFAQEQIIQVAKDTLEGNLRGVIAELTPEEINQKKVIFQQKLVEEAHRDLQRLGLVLDNLQIQNISDDVGYLTSVGRVRGAQVRKNARIGELRAHAAAAVQKAENLMNAEISKVDAETKVAQKDNERRIIEATTQREALIAEARGQVAAQVAEASAQLAAWDARIEQTRRRLEADIVAPADAERARMEEEAKAGAALVLAEGGANAAALASLTAAYAGAGAHARDALLLQKLSPVFDRLTSTLQDLTIRRLTVLGGSAGGNAAALASQLVGVSERVQAASGVDLMAAAAARLRTSSGGGPPPPPA